MARAPALPPLMLLLLPLLFAAATAVGAAGPGAVDARRPRRTAPPPHVFLSQLRRDHAPSPTSASAPNVFDPASFGGDPTGQRDSTSAVLQAVAAAYNVTAHSHFIGNASSHAGATVHLGGGEYLVSQQIELSKGGGGLRVCCGALRAGPAFPADQFLVSLSGGEDTTFEDLQFQSAQRGGGLVTWNALRVQVSRCYFHGFTTAGVAVHSGHEVHVADSFLGQFWWGEGNASQGHICRPPDSPDGVDSRCTGTAIVVEGNDHWVSNVVVFSGLVGIQAAAAATLITNTHIYNGGGTAIVMSGASSRVLASYLDNNGIVLVDPNGIVVADNLFLGAVGVEVRSSGAPEALVSGLEVTRNTFVAAPTDPTGRVGVLVNTTAGPFVAVNDTTVAFNLYPPAAYGPFKGLSVGRRGTRAAASATVPAGVAGANATQWAMDLSPGLAFGCAAAPLSQLRHEIVLPALAAAAASAAAAPVFPRSVLRRSGGCVVVVETDVPLPTGSRVEVSAVQAA